MTVLIVCIVYIIAQRFLTKQFPSESKFVNVRRLTLAILLFFGALIVLLTLPIGAEIKGQILSFVGIIISAALALSSTTLLGNALAALMMRIVNPFQIGDFIRTDDCFGKVTKRGIFHTEIQTEDRNLQTIPNLRLATMPVKVISPSGTILTGRVSLGYDVHRKIVEDALLKAAENVGLENPFVFIMELGDFSVVYEVNGLLEDVNSILSTKSKLHKSILDELHETGIEIVSPSFMNQRIVSDTVFIPKESYLKDQDDSQAEKIIFDKADLAEKLEKAQLDIEELDQRIEELKDKVKKNDGDINLRKELDIYLEMRERLSKEGPSPEPGIQ